MENKLLIFLLTNSIAAGVSWGVVKLIIKEQAKNALKEDLNNIKDDIKELKQSSKEDIKEIKETLGKLFDKVDEVANKLYEFVKDCNVR